jgi:hypothetical protein
MASNTLDGLNRTLGDIESALLRRKADALEGALAVALGVADDTDADADDDEDDDDDQDADTDDTD